MRELIVLVLLAACGTEESPRWTACTADEDCDAALRCHLAGGYCAPACDPTVGTPGLWGYVPCGTEGGWCVDETAYIPCNEGLCRLEGAPALCVPWCRADEGCPPDTRCVIARDPGGPDNLCWPSWAL